MKPIYQAPVIEQLKDLKRACEIALDLLDTVPLRNITAEDMKREGLEKGEFALCDWVVRPRFSNPDCCGKDRITSDYPVFEAWWESLHGTVYATEYGDAKEGAFAGILLYKRMAKFIWDAAVKAAVKPQLSVLRD